MGRTRSQPQTTGIVLDAGALIALNREDKRVAALLERALDRGQTIRVPAGVMGQVWRNGRVQAVLARFLRSDEVEIVPLDEQLARACGEICATRGSSDVIDASVVVIAKMHRESIVTSDPNDLRRLDRKAQLIPI